MGIDETALHLFMDFKKTCDPIRTEMLFNVSIEFDIPVKLVRLIKMFLDGTSSKFHSVLT
jgi:hypothetical protein